MQDDGTGPKEHGGGPVSEGGHTMEVGVQDAEGNHDWERTDEGEEPGKEEQGYRNQEYQEYRHKSSSRHVFPRLPSGSLQP